MCKRLRELAEQLAKIRKEVHGTLESLKEMEKHLRIIYRLERSIFALRHADDRFCDECVRQIYADKTYGS